MTSPSERDRLLEELCDRFEKELARQEAALALCHKQKDGLRKQDTNLLLVATRSLDTLVNETTRAGHGHSLLFDELAKCLGLERKGLRLKTIIEVVPDPWRGRLEDCRNRIQDVLAETRDVVRANAGLLRISLRIVERMVNALEGAAVGAGGRRYTARGRKQYAERLCPAVLDQKG